MIQIIHAEEAQDIEQVRTLFREYEKNVGISLCFQQFEEELAGLPGKYATPDGRLFLALHEGQAVGCIALRKLEQNICEMKRLYLQPAFRGRQANGVSLAVALVATVFKAAREIGYTTMRLDTLPSMTAAIRLYQSVGFYPIAPYYHNPHPDTLFFECEITSTILDRLTKSQTVLV